MAWRANGSISEHQDREANKVQPHQGCSRPFEPRFPCHHCDLCFCACRDSHASHTLPNPADRGEPGWMRESSGCVGPWPVRCRAIALLRSWKIAAAVGYLFQAMQLRLKRLGVAGNSNGLTYESAGKKWRSKAELRKASPIRLLPDSRHNPVLLWEATIRIPSAMPCNGRKDPGYVAPDWCGSACRYAGYLRR